MKQDLIGEIISTHQHTQWTAPIDCVMMFGNGSYMDSNSANYTRIKLYENGSTLVHELITGGSRSRY